MPPRPGQAPPAAHPPEPTIAPMPVRRSLPRHLPLLAAALVCCSAIAQRPPASPAPPFDVAYRAWDVVTDLSKQNRDPAIGGECAKTFRPFVIPGLKPQLRRDQDVAATACVAAAKSACANKALKRDAESEKKCGEFGP